MKEHLRMRLWAASLLKPLFKEELISALKNSRSDECFELLLYCYDKYSDMHPEILSEVFSKHRSYFESRVSVEA